VRLERATTLVDPDAKPGDVLYQRAAGPERVDCRACASSCPYAEPHVHRTDLEQVERLFVFEVSGGLPVVP
jgi:hypothetical protein